MEQPAEQGEAVMAVALITSTQSAALNRLILGLRPDWNPQVVFSAIVRVTPDHDAFDLTRMAIVCATDPRVQDQAFAAEMDKGWDKARSVEPARPGAHRVQAELDQIRTAQQNLNPAAQRRGYQAATLALAGRKGETR